MQQLFKGDNYLREETIRGNTVSVFRKEGFNFDYSFLSSHKLLRSFLSFGTVNYLFEL